MAYGSINADVIGTSVQGYSLGAGNSSLLKNKIINGAMVISQRGTSFAGLTDGSNGTYTLDRWSWSETGTTTGVQTVSKDTSAPTGFINSLKVQTTTAQTVGSGNTTNINQWIEGLNVYDLGWGTADAKSVTLSFWVKSSLTGTFAGGIGNSAFDKSYVFNYTISSANTWEQKSVTIAGPTSGTFPTDNGRSFRILFDLGTGSTYQGTANTWLSGNYTSISGAVSVLGTLNATIQFSGVQLEVGSSATGFEYRQYGQELALCQRYCYVLSGAIAERVGFGWTGTTTLFSMVVPLPVTMRSTPTLTSCSPITVNDNQAAYNSSAITIGASGTPTTVYLAVTSSGMTVGRGAQGYWTNAAPNAAILNSEL